MASFPSPLEGRPSLFCMSLAIFENALLFHSSAVHPVRSQVDARHATLLFRIKRAHTPPTALLLRRVHGCDRGVASSSLWRWKDKGDVASVGEWTVAVRWVMMVVVCQAGGRRKVVQERGRCFLAEHQGSLSAVQVRTPTNLHMCSLLNRCASAGTE